MIIIAPDVMILKTDNKDFKGSDGKQVAYLNARILDTDGNLFELPVSKDLAPDLTDKTNLSGIARIELYAGKSKEGRAVNKLRLLGFEPE